MNGVTVSTPAGESAVAQTTLRTELCFLSLSLRLALSQYVCVLWFHHIMQPPAASSHQELSKAVFSDEEEEEKEEE